MFKHVSPLLSSRRARILAAAAYEPLAMRDVDWTHMFGKAQLIHLTDHISQPEIFNQFLSAPNDDAEIAMGVWLGPNPMVEASLLREIEMVTLAPRFRRQTAAVREFKR